MAGHALDLAALRDCPCAPGLLLHLLSGSVLLPLGLLALTTHALRVRPCCGACSGLGASG